MVEQVEDGAMSIIDFGIKLGHFEQMYHKGSGLFYFPPLKTPHCHATLFELPFRQFSFGRTNGTLLC